MDAVVVTCPAWIEWDSAGIDTHNSGRISMGSNHELTGADRLTGDTIGTRDGAVGNISACHADAQGSIPRRGVTREISNLNAAIDEQRLTQISQPAISRAVLE